MANSTWLSWPVRAALLAPLASVFRDRRADRAGERNVATSLLADYAAGDPVGLAGLLADADDRQFAVLFPKVRERADEAMPVLAGLIHQTPPPDAGDEGRDRLAKRQANAAAALVVVGAASDVREGMNRAAQSLDSGAAWSKVEALSAFR